MICSKYMMIFPNKNIVLSTQNLSFHFKNFGFYKTRVIYQNIFENEFPEIPSSFRRSRGSLNFTLNFDKSLWASVDSKTFTDMNSGHWIDSIKSCLDHIVEYQVKSVDTFMLTSLARYSLLFPCKEGALRSTYRCQWA